MRTRDRLWRWLRAEVGARLGSASPPEPPRAESRSDREGSAREEAPKQSPDEAALRRAYAALELPYGADLRSVRGAYRRLAKRYHPDRFQGEAERAVATELLKRLGAAYRLVLERLEPAHGDPPSQPE